ncbi:hypothetical protein DOY81_006466 [Sarcophaga bullata]|nr:hypothetical protein DOY81_006466 [Sarcophaga bullata]
MLLQRRKNLPTLPLLSIFFLICTIKCISSEVYTALAEMEELLETESVLISNLDGFIKVEQQKLDYLKTCCNCLGSTCPTDSCLDPVFQQKQAIPAEPPQYIRRISDEKLK